MPIKYGQYSFPEPDPVVSFNDDSVLVGGEFDHAQIRIAINGIITGEFSTISLTKSQMISGLFDSFQTLEISGVDEMQSFGFCKAESISFEDSDLTTFLPYSVNFSAFEPSEFSEYFGILDPVNSWSFEEQDQKLILATQTVSAKGIKVSETGALENARNFVSGNLASNIPAVSSFFTPSSYFLYSTEESINQAEGSYQVSQKFRFKDTDAYSYSGDGTGIVLSNTSITLSKENGVEGSVEGSIEASLTGVDLTTGNFTLQEAESIFQQFAANSKSATNEDYDLTTAKIKTFSYTLNDLKNSMDFSFSFSSESDDQDLVNGVANDYTINTSVSKEGGNVYNVTVDGSFSYKGSDLIAETGKYELNDVYIAVSGAFAAFSPYSLASTAYNDFFTSASTEYPTTEVLEQDPVSYNVTKDPVENTISYSYTYSTQPDAGTVTINITDERPVMLDKVYETMNGFYKDTGVVEKNGKLTVSASKEGTGDFGPVETEVLGIFTTAIPNYTLNSSSSKDVSEESSSLSITRYYYD
jgi:hypothetical protein